MSTRADGRLLGDPRGRSARPFSAAVVLRVRRYSVAQFWVFVPVLVAIVALFQVRRGPAIHP